jgi:hypothetical protein
LRNRDIFFNLCDVVGPLGYTLLARVCKTFGAFIELKRDQQAAWAFQPRQPDARSLDEEYFGTDYTHNHVVVTDCFSVDRYFSPFSRQLDDSCNSTAIQQQQQSVPVFPATARMCAPRSCDYYKTPPTAQPLDLPTGFELYEVKTHGVVGRHRSQFGMGCMISFPRKDSYVGMLDHSTDRD